MEQNIVRNQTGLLAKSADAIAGDNKNSGTVTLAYNNAAAITVLRSAAETASTTYGQALTAWRTQKRTLEEKFPEGRVLATIARDVLKPRLGNEWNPDWVETGFVNSLEIPRTPAKLETLLEALTTYYEDNPSYEAPSSGVTAAALGTFHSEFSTLRQTVRTGRTSLRTLVRERKEKFAALRDILRAMAKELTQKIGPLDDRWLDYGFVRPGAAQKPPTPEGFTANVSGGLVLSKWERAARADYYRIFRRIIGQEEGFVQAGTSDDPNFTLEGMPSGSQVELAISAVNSGGESERTAVKSVSIP